MSKPSIQLRGVSLCYRLAKQRIPSFKEYAIHFLRGSLAYEQLWALRDIDLTVEKGETLGIVGRNGAGKSTLLKVISRVMKPTQGTAAIVGHLAPILELGSGFDHELTGLENVYLNALLLGHSRRDIETRVDEIVDFSGLGDFIRVPLRNYSSGMQARLGFAVATAWVPDILILDEVLAVGDMRFQRKCMDKMQLAGREGRTILFVSHGMQAVMQVCKTAMYLKDGRLRTYGPVESAIAAYTLDNVVAAPPPAASAGQPGGAPSPSSAPAASPAVVVTGSGGAARAAGGAAVAEASAETDLAVVEAAKAVAVAREYDSWSEEWLQGEYRYVEGVSELYRETGDFADCIGGRLVDAAGKVAARLPIHQPFRVTLRYRLRRDVPFRVVPNFHFYQQDGQRFFIAFPEHVAPSTAGEYEATCIVPAFLINNGRYTVTLILSSYELPNPVHFAAEKALRFEIHEPEGSDPRRHGWGGGLPGVSRPHLDWEISGK